MYVCVHSHTHTYRHIHIYTCIYIYTYIHIQTHPLSPDVMTCTQAFVAKLETHATIKLSPGMCLFVFMYICVYILTRDNFTHQTFHQTFAWYVSVCMYVYLCAYTHPRQFYPSNFPSNFRLVCVYLYIRISMCI